MKIIISRRALLKKMLLSLVAFVPAIKVLASDEGGNQQPQSFSSSLGPPPPPNASLIVDKYRAGEAVKISQNQIWLRTSSYGDIILNISPQTVAWKGKWNSGLPIEVGDQIKAWGEPQAKSGLDVEKMWINIVNLQGTVSNIKDEAEGLQLRHLDSRQQKSHLVNINQQTLVRLGDKEVEFVHNPVTLSDGQFLQIIGLKLKDGSVLATRLLF